MQKKLAFILFISIITMLLGCSTAEDITNANVNQVFVKPEKFINRSVEITGKLLENPKKTGDDHVLVIAPNPSNPDAKITVKSKEIKGKINIGNFIIIKGIFSDDKPTINASSVEKIEAQEVLAPTLKDITFQDITEDQHGFKVTIDKIEFAQEETRVFVTVKNETKKDIVFYSEHASAFQKTKDEKEQRYKVQKNWEADYQEIPNDIAPEQKLWGIIVFEALNYDLKSARLVFEGFTEERYIKPFEFELKW